MAACQDDTSLNPLQLPREFEDLEGLLRADLRAVVAMRAQRASERLLLTRVLRHTGGNQLQAAQLLGITRNSLRHKLRALDITIARAVCAVDDQPDA